MASRIAHYYSLTKPGVLYGNALTAAAGFLLASGHFGRFNIWLFLALGIGTTLVIASACALNNILDQDIDRKMERTKHRVSVTGAVSRRGAILFSAALGIVGITILALWTNWLVVAAGIVGFIDYVLLYGMLSKRLSMHGTLVGSVSGAMPIFAGYVAVAGTIDTGAVIAFLMVFWWQMPEFYSISIYRHDEYKAAGVPVISVVKGKAHTRSQILAYTVLFVVTSLLLTVYGYTGWIYLIVMAGLGGYWLGIGFHGLRAPDIDAWARRMFRLSMVVILMVCLMVSVGPLLP